MEVNQLIADTIIDVARWALQQDSDDSLELMEEIVPYEELEGALDINLILQLLSRNEDFSDLVQGTLSSIADTLENRKENENEEDEDEDFDDDVEDLE